MKCPYMRADACCFFNFIRLDGCHYTSDHYIFRVFHHHLGKPNCQITYKLSCSKQDNAQ